MWLSEQSGVSIETGTGGAFRAGAPSHHPIKIRLGLFNRTSYLSFIFNRGTTPRLLLVFRIF